ncbi:hypothetical protein EXN66_Car017476 [Channa argus]|uniref:Uncharacterized protein n=1 Tax=Channa argus TaxID=215402 RepID=A0A6G1QHR6_CHAAH|nr:hypothetical protein EXN66_Car017476 [Channa argus]
MSHSIRSQRSSEGKERREELVLVGMSHPSLAQHSTKLRETNSSTLFGMQCTVCTKKLNCDTLKHRVVKL